MAKSSNNDNDPIPLPVPLQCQEYPETKKAVSKFQGGCMELRQNVSTPAINTANAHFSSAIKTVCDDRRALDKGEATRTFYYSIYHHVAIGLAKDMQEAQKQSDELVVAMTELNKTLAAAIAKMKDCCGKLQNVKKMASDWNTAVCASCNSKSKTELNRLLNPGTPPNQEPPDTLKDHANAFDIAATAVQNAGDQVSETAVKVSGILSFTNLKSVKECADRLKALADTFKTDVEGNIKASEDKIKAAQKVLAEDLPKLSEADFARRKTKAAWESVNTMVNYLSVFPPAPNTTPATLAAICAEVSICSIDLPDDND